MMMICDLLVFVAMLMTRINDYDGGHCDACCGVDGHAYCGDGGDDDDDDRDDDGIYHLACDGTYVVNYGGGSDYGAHDVDNDDGA